MNIKAVLTLLFSSFIQIAYNQSVERIEPPHWWTGMKDQTLQIMLYGRNIGNLQPVVDYDGIQIKSWNSPENINYLFIDLIISELCKNGTVPIILTGANKEIIIDYRIENRHGGSAERQGFNSSDAIYLLTPDRFANGDLSNDNITGMNDPADRTQPFGRHGGDLKGISQHLDYIANQGFTSLWLNPVLENDMPRSSYHGYAITDFYKVDARFGSNESFRQLCADARGKGIKMIMDMVANHCGLAHWWMNDLPTKDWINYNEGTFIQTNHRKTVSSDPYAADLDKDLLTRGWFVRTMPDLNTKNPYMAKYLIQNAIWWIEYADLGGIRMDTYLYPDEQFMSDWSKSIMAEYPNFNITGEVWYEDPGIISYWQVDKENKNGYVSYLPSLCDFPLQHALNRSLHKTESWEDGWIPLYEMIGRDFSYPHPENLVVFADNHDMSRIYTQVNEDYNQYKLALAYILTTRGIPQVYYGTEVLMSNRGTDSHGIIRSDFPGGWPGDTINAFNGKGLTAQQKDAQSYLKKLLMWRKNAEVIHSGKMMHYTPKDNVYVFFRYNEHESVMIILNKNNEPTQLDLSRYQSSLKNATKGFDIMTGEEIDLHSPIHLANEGPRIIEFKY